MAQNTYPDGFPLTPLEAIDFSYTFSTEEKQEWREWVKTATADQQQELVETLHAIWIDNQKEVVPAGFTKTSVDSPAKPAENQVAPEINNLNNATPVIAPVTPVPAPKLDVKVPDVKVETSVPQNIVKEEKEFVFNNTPNQAVGIKPPVIEAVIAPTPVNQPRSQPEKDSYNNRNQRPQNNPATQNTQNNPSQRNNTNSSQSQQGSNPARNDLREQQSEPKKVEMNFFDFAKVRENSTKNQVESLQKDYIAARQQKLELENRYGGKLVELNNDLDRKHQVLFDKVVQIALNFENVSDYLQAMTEKLLKTNESNIELEKKVKSLELVIENKFKDHLYDKENTQHDIDRLFRDLRELRDSLRSEILDLKKASSTSTVDNFGDDGVKLKIEIMANKLIQLENNLASSNKQLSQEKTVVYKGGQQENTSSKVEKLKLTKNTDEKDATLDLRDIV